MNPRRAAGGALCLLALTGAWLGSAVADSSKPVAIHRDERGLGRSGGLAYLGRGTVSGTSWAVTADATAGGRGKSRTGCIVARAGRGDVERTCGRLGAKATSNRPPLFALAAGRSGGVSVLGMSTDPRIAVVILTLGSGKTVSLHTRLLGGAVASAAGLRRFRYVASAAAGCIERAAGFDRGGRRMFGSSLDECAPPTGTQGGSEMPPGVILETPSYIPEGAVLRGSINPGGSPTGYRFEWGPTPAYGHQEPVPAGSAGGGQAPQAVQASISGLRGSTTYYYRLVADNGRGEGSAAGEFATPSWRPTVSFEAPTEITKRSATIHAGIDPEGLATGYRFEWGPSKAYGYSFEAPTELAGSAQVPVSQELGNLEGETTYFYRVVAENEEGAGEAKGAFSTLPSDATRRQGSWTSLKLADRSGGLSVSNRLTGISCFSLTQCMAVGEFEEESLPVQELTERRDESKWSEEPTPEEPLGVVVGGVSCVSPVQCFAVGHYVTASGNVTLAEFWNGAEWKIQATPNPALGGALTAVSCVTAQECTAVGYYHPTAGEIKSLALRWDGSDWSTQATPNLPGAKLNELTGVSCNSFLLAGLFERECVAAGYAETLVGRDQAISARWDGSEWKSEAVPLPEEEAKESVLAGISCAESTECQAVGYIEEKSGAVVPLSDYWSGIFDPKWQPQAPHAPAGATASRLTGVSCNDTAAIECMAVGNYEDSTGAVDSFADQWFNHEAWSVLGTPAPEHAHSTRLNGISCEGSRNCVAVGYYLSATGVEEALGEQFGG